MSHIIDVLKQKKVKLFITVTLGTFLIFLFILSALCIGPAYVSLTKTISILLNVDNKQDYGNLRNIVLNIRLPRALCAVIFGAALSVAGALAQATLRNPLVDPYILGVSSGAAFGAALFLLLGFSMLILPAAAFISGMIAFIITIFLSRLAGGTTISVVLSGIAIGTLFSSLLTLLIYFCSEEKSHYIVLWLTGSLSTIRWSDFNVAFPVITILLVYVLLRAKELNVILLGDEQAMQLGINIEKLKYEVYTLVALLASIPTAYSGIIGFIGLMSPHICRLIVGSDHRLLLPASIVVGANMLLLADLVAKSAYMLIMPSSPTELPLGALISMIGAPYFIYLLIKVRGRYAL